MASAKNNIVNTVLPLPIYSSFDYAINDIAIEPGIRVRVPFGSKEKIALTVGEQVFVDIDKCKIKQIHQQLDESPILSVQNLQFLRWVADYYIQPLGEVVFLALPLYLKKGAPTKATTELCWVLASDIDHAELNLDKKAPKQHSLIQVLLLEPKGVIANQLSAQHKNWRPVMKILLQKGWVVEAQTEQFNRNYPKKAPLTLNQEQQAVADDIKQQGAFSVHVIDGITGSGKTEVYFDVMQQIVDSGKQVLFMLPEIGLTNAFIKRICQRFGEEVAVIHSGKTPWQRYIAWDQAKRGVAKILIATRSGVFVEFKNLGLIIIDEEHDSSYRQEDGVYYHGRDCAVKKAQMFDIPVIMGSATPSLETLKNCDDGVYTRYELNSRAKNAQLADMHVINTLDKPLQSGCSVPLRKAITKHLEQKGQVILFLNRRGFAPILMCHECGWRKNCVACEAPMSLHRSVNKMICHHCAEQNWIPNKCEECGSDDIQHYGVGTQQLEEKIKQLYPDVLVERIDRDSTRLKDEFNQKLALLQSGQSGIFIGTQMLAKGHDYAGITLVGILNMDQGLFSTQYRATERLAQTIIQVSGRAGRGDKKGEVLLQTDFPEHEIMPDLLAQDYRTIASKLLKERALYDLPPYLKVITFRADAMALNQAEEILQSIKDAIDNTNAGIQTVGPFPSYLKKQQGRYRAQLHCHSKQIKQLRKAVIGLMPTLLKLKKPKFTKWRVDVDPMDL